MVDFVQWGSSSLIGRSEVASLKGIWFENPQGVYDFVATAADGESVAFSGINTGGGFLTLSSDLANGPPTPRLGQFTVAGGAFYVGPDQRNLPFAVATKKT